MSIILLAFLLIGEKYFSLEVNNHMLRKIRESLGEESLKKLENGVGEMLERIGL